MPTNEDYEPEKDEGFIEYKQKLTDIPSKIKLEKLTTQLNFRLNEGKGECIYVIGVADDGEILGLSKEDFLETLSVLENIASEIDAEAILIRKQTIDNKFIGEVLIRRERFIGFPLEIVVAVIGNVDSGKSSLIGSLISGEKDDGDGLTRQFVMRHPHEILSGRTSSVASKILGFQTDGTIVNYSNLGKIREEDIIKQSSKLIRMIDLAGHEKYLKTTIFGMLGTEPDYASIFVDANRGVQRMTKEHLGLASVLKIPFFCVLTKIDLAPALVYKKTLNDLKKLLKSPVLSFIPKIIKDYDDIAVLAPILHNGKIVPIIPVSIVTGKNMDLLSKFLNLLAPRKHWSQNNQISITNSQKEHNSNPFLLFIEEWFQISGLGPVLAGIVQSGDIKVGTLCSLGPDTNGNYLKVKIRSIQSRRIPLERAFPGQYVSMSLAFTRGYPRHYRKGMILTTYDTPKSFRKFEAEIRVLHHPTTINLGYSSQIHCKTIRAQARITKIQNTGPLRTGDNALVEMEFLYAPYFLFEGMEFVFREGRTKGYGVIKKLIT
ncbi:MAG: GTP-binding protein [Candidatus Hodarchaeales archaeon]|jgi:elongation factor 1-alpha